MSDLNWAAESQAPDLIITGGFMVTEAIVPSLLSSVRDIKKRISSHPDVPAKWNLKDISRALKLHGLQSLEKKLLASADELRTAMLDALVQADAKLFLSMLQAHSRKKQVLGATRADLVRFSFSNVLMRAGLRLKLNAPADSARVLIDWPEKAQATPFVAEYRSAYCDGCSGEIKYLCGPLHERKFEPGLSFGVTDIDPLLQLADMVVGASRAFARSALNATPETDFGVRQFRRLLPLFHTGSEGELLGYGIVVSPKESKVRDVLIDALKKTPAST